MAVLRVIAGVAMTLFAGAYYLIGMLFISGDATNPEFSRGLAVAFIGLCGPVILCGLHLMVFGRKRSVRAHAIMVAALVLSLLIAIVAMVPFLQSAPPQPEALNVILGCVVSTALFGWPMVRGLVQALLSRPD